MEKKLEKLQVKSEKLRLLVFKSAIELGTKVDEHLLDKYGLDKKKYTFIQYWTKISVIFVVG